VKAIRPDLDDDQAWEILQQLAAACEDCPATMQEIIRQLGDMSYPNSKTTFHDRLARLAGDIDALPERERDNPAAYGETAAKLDALESQVKGA
jgi:DNA-binding FrmR family transcriptional regulator